MLVRAFGLALFAAAFLTTAAGAENAVDPERYDSGFEKRLATREGEDFCWQAAYTAPDFLRAYQAWKDVRWLERAEAFDDYLVSRLKKDPDGCEGWIGKSYFIDRLNQDTVVGDAILCKTLLEFAEIVRDDPKLKARFGAKAQKYIDLATRICWDKFNRRGQYYEDGGWGSYRTYGRLIDPATNKWVEMPDAVISDNLNKHYAIGIALLRLWRLTGRDEYRERVETIFGRHKEMARYFRDEDRVVWNFWMPHGTYDMPGTAPKSWVGVHSSRPGYQVAEVEMFVEVYDSGLVFEQVDLERMIRTNHWMMDHGLKSADGTSNAGAVWDGLARFDEKIRKACEKDLLTKPDDKKRIELAYLENVTMTRAGWDRWYVKSPAQVRVAKIPPQDGRNVSLALVIPSTVELVNNARVKLATQVRAGGKLTIELLDATGRNVLGTLFEKDVDAQADSYLAPAWDGTNPKTGRKDEGEYRIRWTLAGETRVEPAWVKPGVKRERTGPQELKAGDTLAVDFEKPLDARWTIQGKGAGISAEQAHGGRASLKIPSSSEAVLLFGDQDNLPVRVTLWIYDENKKLGRENANGGGWGVREANGNVFCVRQSWRKYLNGDAQYAWFNTGENQWFNPHPGGLTRKAGWTQWVLDFTQKTPAVIGGDTTLSVAPAAAAFVPKGGIAIFLTGGDGKAGSLYVDDLRVEYPKN